MEVNRDGKHLISPFLKGKTCLISASEESEPLPFHMTPLFIIDPKWESVCALSPKIDHSTR